MRVVEDGQPDTVPAVVRDHMRVVEDGQPDTVPAVVRDHMRVVEDGQPDTVPAVVRKFSIGPCCFDPSPHPREDAGPSDRQAKPFRWSYDGRQLKAA